MSHPDYPEGQPLKHYARLSISEQFEVGVCQNADCGITSMIFSRANSARDTRDFINVRPDLCFCPHCGTLGFGAEGAARA